MVTSRAHLVSGNLFLKNSNCCSAQKSVLGELDWFSGENLPSKMFPLEKFLSRKVSTGNVSAGKSFCRKFSNENFFLRKLFRWKKFPDFPPSGGNFRDGNLLELQFPAHLFREL